MAVRRACLGILILACGVITTAGRDPQPASQSAPPTVLFITVDRNIDHVTQGFIAHAVSQAEQEHAALLVIQLDTPGGEYDATRKIVQQLLAANVPVAVYVAPKGARAASAGTFILAAANFAAMAPGTNIGAASPVSANGKDIGGTLQEKVTNDAAALIRSIAQERGRNGDKLEVTVRKAVSFSASEAVDAHIVDFIAKDTEDLLTQLNGKTAQTAGGPDTPRRTSFGKTVKTLRERRDLSQSMLAQSAKLTQPYLAQIERGVRRNPSLKTLRNIARALGVPVETLMSTSHADLTDVLLGRCARRFGLRSSLPLLSSTGGRIPSGEPYSRQPWH